VSKSARCNERANERSNLVVGNSLSMPVSPDVRLAAHHAPLCGSASGPASASLLARSSIGPAFAVNDVEERSIFRRLTLDLSDVDNSTFSRGFINSRKL